MNSEEVVKKLLDKITCQSPGCAPNKNRLEPATALVCHNGHARCSACENYPCPDPRCRSSKATQDLTKNTLLRDILSILGECKEQCTHCLKWIGEGNAIHKQSCSSRTVKCLLCENHQYTTTVKDLKTHIQTVHKFDIVGSTDFITFRSISLNESTPKLFGMIKNDQVFFVNEVGNNGNDIFAIHVIWVPNEPNPEDIYMIKIEFGSDNNSLSPLASPYARAFNYQSILETHLPTQMFNFPSVFWQSLIKNEMKHKIIITTKRFAEARRDSTQEMNGQATGERTVAVVHQPQA